MQNIIFDLDGTLIDSANGILLSLASAAKDVLDIEINPMNLRRYLGISLRNIFPEILNTNNKEIIEEAVRLYRRHYDESGLFIAELYEGIEDLLISLKNSNEKYKLFIATAKNRPAALTVAKTFMLDQYFEEIHGPDLGGKMDDKAELLSYMIEQHNLKPEHSIMIGDRSFDMIAGKKNGMKTIGVTYGYGDLEELENVNADYICDTAKDIFNIVSSLNS